MISRDSGELSLVGARKEMQVISDYAWEGPRHLKEAIKVFISAHLDEPESESAESFFGRFTPKERLEVDKLLAGNPLSSVVVLDFLARRSYSWQVHALVSANPHTAQNTLYYLVEHEQASVRSAIAERTDLDAHLLACLAADASPDVRYALAENPLLPEETLLILTNDENPFVASRANESLRRQTGGQLVEWRKAPSAIPQLRVVG